MNILKALAAVGGPAVAFAAAGAGIGGLLGAFAPSYFRQMFRVRDEAHFDPVELGVGLGTTQGLIWGLVVGVAIVAIIGWKESRIARKD